MIQNSKADLKRELEKLNTSLIHMDDSIKKNKPSSVILSNQDLQLRYQWIHSTHPNIESNQFVGKTDLEIDSFVNASQLNEIKKQVIQSGKPIRHLTQFRLSAGIIELDISSIPVYGELGKITGVTSIAVDVSKFNQTLVLIANAREQIEKQVIARLDHLQVIDDNLMNLTQLLPFIFCTCKADGSYKTTFISSNVKDITGYNARDFLQNSSFWVDHIHPDDKISTLSNISELFNRDYQELEYRFKVADGSYRWLRNILHLVEFSDDHDSRFIFAVWYDITEQKFNKEELTKIKAQAEEAIQIKSQFLSRMSHELRTPLNSILGYAQLLRENLSDASRIESMHLDNIIKSGWHMLQIVSDILDFTLMVSNKIELYKEDYELSKIMVDCLDAIQPMANKKNINVACDIDSFRHQFVHIDPARTKQVLMNLLSNAVKYNNDDGDITIDLELRQDNILRINVIDTGVGIAAKDIPDLFKPFSQLYLKTYAIDGTGIGLAVSKRLVELMDGTIGVVTSQEKGSCFYIEFKKQNSLQLQKSIAVANVTIKDNIEKSGEYKILYIEDSPSHIRLVEEILRGTTDIKLISAMNSKIGLELAGFNLPDLIILDICLPDMDGFHILQRLQNDKTTNSIPVVALSANALPAEIDKAIKAGFTRYLTKPINVVDFKKIILELLPSKE